MINEIIADVIGEMERQDAKWGDQSYLPFHTWNSILAEELGEVACATLANDYPGQIEELIQVAAVAIQYARAVKLHRVKEAI